ncbi:hypothetical protein ACJX0J_020527 [Zea mays]
MIPNAIVRLSVGQTNGFTKKEEGKKYELQTLHQMVGGPREQRKRGLMAPVEMKVQDVMTKPFPVDEEILGANIILWLTFNELVSSKLYEGLISIGNKYGNFLYFHVFVSDFSLLHISIPLPCHF